MKKLLLSTAAAVVLAGPAFAADLPRASEPVAPAPYIAPAAFDWTGFYVGANVGGAFGGKFKNDFADRFGSASGVTVGGQAGYNYQIDQFVLGIEGDIQYQDMRKRDNVTGDKATSDWKGSITPRVGYAFDRFLPYVKGGFAFGNVKLSAPALGGSDSSTETGWTVGGGLEYAFTNNITGKIEYDYTDLSKDKFNIGGVTGKVGYRASEVKAGINYKF